MVNWGVYETDYSLEDGRKLFPESTIPVSYTHLMTPWGGDALRAVYGRDIPDERTGEALEISAMFS